jgi:hypothetical protein
MQFLYRNFLREIPTYKFYVNSFLIKPTSGPNKLLGPDVESLLLSGFVMDMRIDFFGEHFNDHLLSTLVMQSMLPVDVRDVLGLFFWGGFLGRIDFCGIFLGGIVFWGIFLGGFVYVSLYMSLMPKIDSRFTYTPISILVFASFNLLIPEHEPHESMAARPRLNLPEHEPHESNSGYPRPWRFQTAADRAVASACRAHSQTGQTQQLMLCHRRTPFQDRRSQGWRRSQDQRNHYCLSH